MTELRDRIDQVADRYDGEKASLYRVDGRQRYAGAEHTERMGALRERFHSEMDSLEAEIGEEINRNVTALAAVEFSDPVDSLSAEDLQRGPTLGGPSLRKTPGIYSWRT